MAEVERRLLVRDQLAYIEKITADDQAYLKRHALTDPESLLRLVDQAVRRGELRLAQVPDRRQAGRPMVSPGYSPPTREQRLASLQRTLQDLAPPPRIEVEELLDLLATPERRLEYLTGLRDRMDEFERAAYAAESLDKSLADMALGEDYLDLVRIVLHHSKLNRTQVKEREYAEETLNHAPETNNYEHKETPLPEPGDDGRRDVYKAVSDYLPRGIERGKRYELWPGDVLVKAGVVKPLSLANSSIPVKPVDSTSGLTGANSITREQAGSHPDARNPIDHPFYTSRNVEGALFLLRVIEAEPEREWKSQNEVARAIPTRAALGKEDRSVVANAKRLLEALGCPVTSEPSRRKSARILVEALRQNAGPIRQAAVRYGLD